MPTNPTPWYMRLLQGWPSIMAKVNMRAGFDGRPTYSQTPTAYRFDGWGVVIEGGNLLLVCNVKYFSPSGQMTDLGRFVGR